jgi:predicted DNA-binding transcriptional regulator AlpA
MLSARTVSARLRKRRAWVYEMCASGAWPGATRLGGSSWRIPEQSILAWLEEQERRERE